MTELQTDLIESGKRDNYMTTATETKLDPILDNLITVIPEQTDEDVIVILLNLFDVRPANIPIERLVTDVALAVDENGMNWLAVNEFDTAWLTLFQLISRGATRIPAADVYRALANLLQSGADEDGTSILLLSELALLIPVTITPFRDDILDTMQAYGERDDIWRVRLAVVRILDTLGRGAECADYIEDEDYDVASEAIEALPHTPETRGLLEELLTDEDLHADVIAAAQRVIAEIDGADERD